MKPVCASPWRWDGWYARGLLDEGKGWLARAADTTVPIAPAVRAAALQEASDLALRRRDLVTAGLATARLVLLADAGRPNNWRGHRAAESRQCGLVLRGRCQAVRHYEEALVLARDQDAPMLAAMALNNMAEVALNRDDLTAAEIFATDAVSLQQELGQPFGAAWSRMVLGECAAASGRLQAAADHFRIGITLARAHADVGFVSVGLVGLEYQLVARMGPGGHATIWRRRGACGRLAARQSPDRYDEDIRMRSTLRERRWGSAHSPPRGLLATR
ncbi:MAG: hypothetical protein U0075_13545 [Thermomicrobiales bacterium]